MEYKKLIICGTLILMVLLSGCASTRAISKTIYFEDTGNIVTNRITCEKLFCEWKEKRYNQKCINPTFSEGIVCDDGICYC